MAGLGAGVTAGLGAGVMRSPCVMNERRADS